MHPISITLVKGALVILYISFVYLFNARMVSHYM